MYQTILQRMAVRPAHLIAATTGFHTNELQREKQFLLVNLLLQISRALPESPSNPRLDPWSSQGKTLIQGLISLEVAF